MLLRGCGVGRLFRAVGIGEEGLPIGRSNLLEAAGAGTSELHDNNDHRTPGSLMDLFQIQARAPLFFMHIPKTAGMSMRLYLREQYDVHDVCPAARWHDLLGREHELAGFRLVQGHFRYNLRNLLAGEARMLVMLREPLRRTVSALLHLQRDASFHRDHELAQGLSLSAMIRDPVLMQNQRNVQARFLCASNTPDQVSGHLEQELPRNPAADAGDFEDPPDLDLATARLETIDFIGLTEDIGAVLRTMAEAMNYHPPLYFPFINENPNRTDPLRGLNDKDMEILRDNNDIDLPLYQYAQRLIERRSFQHHMGQLVGKGIYQVPPGSFEIPMAGVMPGSGWYEPEVENGSSWRWTGPGRHFTVEVPLRADASYRLKVDFGSLRPLGEDDFAAEVNHVAVAIDLTHDGGSYHGELTVPRDLLRLNAGFCLIRFDTRETTKLAAADIRALGVSVRRIVFECLDA
jgi:hypothetical protein